MHLSEFYTAEIALLRSLTGTKAGDLVTLPPATAVEAATKVSKHAAKTSKGASDEADGLGDDNDSAVDETGVDEVVSSTVGKRKNKARSKYG